MGFISFGFGLALSRLIAHPSLSLSLGFGLRVNHYLHQVAKAAGISDLSAKVYGSRNGTRVIKLAIAMLHNGSNPVGSSSSSFFFFSFSPADDG